MAPKSDTRTYPSKSAPRLITSLSTKCFKAPNPEPRSLSAPLSTEATEATERRDGGDPERAGKSFDVTFDVKELKEKVLPDADDDLAKDIGSFDTLDEIKAEFRSQAEKRAEREDEQHLRTQLIQKLIDANVFDPPETLTEREIDSRIEAAARDLYQKGVDPAKAGIDWNAVRAEQRASAEAAVKATLLLDRLAQQESIEVTEEEVSAELQKASEVLEKSPEALRAQMMKDGSLERLTGRLRREKAVDFIKQHAKLQ